MPVVPPRLARLARSIRREVLLRRRFLAALCTLVGVLLTVRAIVVPAPTESVLVAARDLPAGTTLTAGDLATAMFAADTAPPGATTASDAMGRVLAAPLGSGEPVTRVRLLAPGLLDGYPGLVAVPVRIPDAGAVGLVRVGDLIDLLATDPAGAGTITLARQVPVIALPESVEDSSGLLANSALSGRLIVVGATPDLSEKIADASVRRFLTVVWSG